MCLLGHQLLSITTTRSAYFLGRQRVDHAALTADSLYDGAHPDAVTTELLPSWTVVGSFLVYEMIHLPANNELTPPCMENSKTYIVYPIELVSEMRMISIHTICQSIISIISCIPTKGQTHEFHSFTSLGVNLTSDIVVAGVEWYRFTKSRLVNCRSDRLLSKKGINSAMIARVIAARVYMIVRVGKDDFCEVGGALCWVEVMYGWFIYWVDLDRTNWRWKIDNRSVGR